MSSERNSPSFEIAPGGLKSLSLFDSTLLYLQVNIDGMITFADDTSDYGIDPFPYSYPAVAALIADIDTSNNIDGRLFYRQTTDTDILQRATNDVADRTGFTATWVFIATWHNVTHYGGDNDTPVRTVSLMKTVNKPLIYI